MTPPQSGHDERTATDAGQDRAARARPAFYLEHVRTLRKQGATAAALDFLDALIGQHGQDAAFLNAYGLFLQEIGDHTRAAPLFRRAAALDPSHPGYRFNLGLSLLALGELENGWPLYEHGRRLHRADPLRRYSAPEWQGELVQGKTLYLWEEQGVGDTLLYGAMIGDLQMRGARCVLECDPRLVPLFRRSFPGLEVVPSGPFADIGLKGRTFDFHAPLGSIGRFLRPTLAAFPPPRPFLRADAERVTAFRRQLASLGPEPKIGISWRSASASFSEKSIPLTEWGPVLSAPNRRFVALQYGDCQVELADAAARFGVDIFEPPGLNRFRDIDGLAALVQACDAVVTISNVTANVAGALGRPTLLLLGPATLWYWFQDREDSPWYANMHLLRTQEAGSWGPVLERAAKRIEDLLA